MAQIRNLCFQPGVDAGCGRFLSSQQTDSAHFRSQTCREQDLKQMLSKVGGSLRSLSLKHAPFDLKQKAVNFAGLTGFRRSLCLDRLGAAVPMRCKRH